MSFTETVKKTAQIVNESSHVVTSFIIGILFLFFLSFFFADVNAGNVSGTIVGTVVWNNSGSPYTMTGNVTVSNGAVLTIDASSGPVEVVAGGNYSIGVASGGTLNVIGTSGNTVTFRHTSATTAGAWGGIRVDTGGNATVQYAYIRNASYGLRSNGGTSTVTDTIFETNSFGVMSHNGGSMTTARNTFNKNTNTPVAMDLDSVLNLGVGVDADSIGAGALLNGFNGIGLESNSSVNACPGNVCTVYSKTFAGFEKIPYVAFGNVLFDDGDAVVNIDPGVTLKMVTGSIYVRNGGTLNINGTALNPVTITSARDDSIYGDTNNNGTATVPAVANWGDIHTDAGNTLNIQYGVIRYSDAGARSLGGSLTVTDSVIELSYWGLGTNAGGSLTTARNTIRKITYTPVTYDVDSTLNLGQGADADILGTGADKNGYTAIGFWESASVADCPGNICSLSQRTFAGISNIPYVANGNLLFDDANGTVNIDAGVTIKFVSGIFYARNGCQVNINGASGNPVTITSVRDDSVFGDTNNNGTATVPANANWAEIRTEGNSIINMQYTTVRYADIAVISRSGVITVVDSIIENSNWGLGANTGGTLTTARNVIRKITNTPVTYDVDSTLNFGQGVDADILGTGAEQNGYTAVGFWSSASVADCPGNVCTISQRTFAGIPNIPYVGNGNILFDDADGTVNIDAGVTIKMVAGIIYARNGCHVNFNGTNPSPVTVTSVRDDTVFGDTNNNGTANNPVAGNWSEIRTEGTSVITIQNTLIRYGDTTVLSRGGSITISDSTVELSNWGIGSYNGGTLNSARNVLRKITNTPVTYDIDSTLNLGQGVNADVLGTGTDKNGYTAIGFFDGSSAGNCPGNVCTISQQNLAGIANIPYVAFGNVYLEDADGVVNIDPGVVIKFNIGTMNTRSGCDLYINGTALNPVILTSSRDDTVFGDTNNNGSTNSPAVNNWGEIRAEASSTATIQFAVVKYSSDGIRPVGGIVTVSDSVFENNAYSLGSINGGTLTTARNTIRKGTYTPVVTDLDSILNLGQGVDADIIGTGSEQNGYTGIGIYAGASVGACVGDVCAVSQRSFAGIPNIPYIAMGHVYFEDPTGVVNIDPGVVIKSVSGALYIRSGCRINIQGTVANPVYVTSVRDDTVGGDSNNNGSSNTPAVGNWTGFILQTGTNTVVGAEIRYASSGINASAGTLAVTDSDFENNAVGITLTLASSPVFTRVNFVGNSSYGIQNTNATIVNAENLWWNNVNGPNDTDAAGSCPLNATTGDRVSDTSTNRVDYCPYATTKWNEITNTLPVAANVLINQGALAIDLTENTTTNVLCETEITDADGWEDIANVSAILYRTSLGYIGANDQSFRYSTACTAGVGTGNSRSYSCSIPVWFFADATDTGSPNAGDSWSCRVTPYDSVGEGTSDTDLIEMNSLLGIQVPGNIGFGNLDPGTNTGATNTVISVSNTGNTTLDLELSGVAMCKNFPTCTGTTIPVENQQYASTAFTYGNGTTLTPNLVKLVVSLGKANTYPSNQLTQVYWGLALPSVLDSGNYSGSNTIVGVLAQ